MTALTLHRIGNVDEACETYRELFELADDLDNAEMKARTAKALGIAYRDAGKFGQASSYLLIAMQLYQSMNKPAMLLRMRWSIARMALAVGSFTEAVRQLQPIIGEFEEKGMMRDAQDAYLDLAEAYFLLGKIDLSEDILAGCVAYYRNQELITGALTAVSFLRECAAKKHLSRGHFTQVRKFLEEVREDRQRLFVPTPDTEKR